MRTGSPNKLLIPRYYQDPDDYACGPTCVRMVLNFFWRLKKNCVFIRQGDPDYSKILGITMNGNSMRSCGTYREDLMIALRAFNVKPSELQGDVPEKLKRLRTSIKRGHPAILSCIGDFGEDERMGHFIVMTGIDDKNLYINDPYPSGPNKVKIASFLKRGQPINWDEKKWGITIEPVSIGTPHS